MTNEDIRRTALEQSAIDCSCAPEDFLKTENVIVAAGADPRARAYLPRPVECDLVSYGSNVVAQVSGREAGAATVHFAKQAARPSPSPCMSPSKLHIFSW